MNETQVTVVGNLTADPIMRITQGGDPFVTFRVACTERRRDGEGRYYDAHTSFYSVTCFRNLASNVAASLNRGARVVVTGRLRLKEWTTAERQGMSGEIDALAVGPDLAWCHARVTRGTATATVPGADRLDDEHIRAALAQIEERVVDVRTGEVLDEPQHAHPAPDHDAEDGAAGQDPWASRPAEQEPVAAGR